MGPINPDHIRFAKAAIKAEAMTGMEIVNVLAIATMFRVSPDSVQDAFMDAKQAVRIAMADVRSEIVARIGEPPEFGDMDVSQRLLKGGIEKE